jgi:hypothetical protein
MRIVLFGPTGYPTETSPPTPADEPLKVCGVLTRRADDIVQSSMLIEQTSIAEAGVPSFDEQRRIGRERYALRAVITLA